MKNTKEIREFAARGKYENAPWYTDTINILCDEVDRLTEKEDGWIELVNDMEHETIKDKAEIARLRKALEYGAHCGLAISHGMRCPVIETLNPKEKPQ